MATKRFHLVFQKWYDLYGRTTTPPGKLATPTNPAVSSLSASSLSVSCDPVTGASNYRLERATNAAFTQGLALVFTGGSTSFTDTNLAASTTYYYRWTALGDSKNADSDPSAVVTGRTKDAALPVAPGDMGGVPSLNIMGSDWGNLTRETKQNVTYAFANGNGSTYLAGNLPTGAGAVKGAGNYTWTAPKKPFNLYLAAASTELGLASGKTRRSLAEYNDPTLLRNYAAYDLLRRFGVLAPDTRPVEVSLDGTYYGLYTYTTKPDKIVASVVGKRAFVVEKVLTDQQGDLSQANYWETPYYGTNNYVGPKYAMEDHGILLENPEFGSATADEITAAKALIARYEASLEYDYSDQVNGPQSVADNNSNCANYLVQEFLKNPDGESASSYMYQGADGKLYFVAWDFDQSAPVYQGATDTSPKNFWTRATPYYAKLFANGFSKAVEAYYQANRPAFVAMIADVQSKAQLFTNTGVAERNNTKWNIYQQDGNKLPDGTVLPTYQQHVDTLVDWLNQRLAWFDVVYGAPTYGYVDYLTFTDGDTNRIAVPQLTGIRTVRLWFQSMYLDATRRSILLDLPGIATIGYDRLSGGTIRVNGKPYDPSQNFDGMATGEWQNVVLELPQAATTPAGLWRFFAGKQGRLEFYGGTLTSAQCVAERLITEAGPLAAYNSRISGRKLLDESGNGNDAVLYGTLPQSTRPPVAATRSPKPTEAQSIAFNMDRGGYAFNVPMEAGTYDAMMWLDLRSSAGYPLDLRGFGGPYMYTNEVQPPGPTLYFNQADQTWNMRPIQNAGFTRVTMRNIPLPQGGLVRWLQQYQGNNEGISAYISDFRLFKSGFLTDADLADEESAPTAGLYLHYAMDAPATGNDTLPDLSGNGRDGTLSGF